MTYYNILNIVVNTEPILFKACLDKYYNILNIMVNVYFYSKCLLSLTIYKILNIVVNLYNNLIIWLHKKKILTIIIYIIGGKK